jgi:hypothetical protein
VNEQANTVTISNSNSKGDFITVDFANNAVNITSGSAITLTSNTITMNAGTISMTAKKGKGGGGDISINADKIMETKVAGHSMTMDAETNDLNITSADTFMMAGKSKLQVESNDTDIV